MSEEFSPAVHRDLLGLLLGEKLGAGVARRVYVHGMDPTRVVKVEDTAGSFQNVCEWELWQTVKGVHNVAKWLAPCLHISACGSILVQERVADAKAFPAKVPAFFADLKLANFGMRGRQFVARDYGTTHIRIAYLGIGQGNRMRVLRGTTADGWAIQAGR